jgi:hypothetical protein
MGYPVRLIVHQGKKAKREVASNTTTTQPKQQQTQ